MASQQSTIDEITDLLEGLDIRTRKMFGEYALYCDEKVVGFVCDDRLLLKVTDAGRALIEQPAYRQAYPGSKDYLYIEHDLWFEKDYLKRLVQATTSELPRPKPKK